MGTRVPEHIVRNMKTQKLTSLFLPPEISYKPPSLPTGFHYPPGCKYSEDYTTGFLVNIAHPSVAPYYAAFLKFLGTIYPLDDSDRKFFEADMILNVFRAEYMKSPIYSLLDIERLGRIQAENQKTNENQKSFDDWVQYRTELFGAREAAG